MPARAGRGYDVVVVGGGIIGLSAAYHLACEGARVAVVERERPGLGASGAAAGILAPGHEAAGDGAFLDLCLRGYALWPDFARRIEAESGIATGLVLRGTAVVAPSAGAARELRARLAGDPAQGEWVEGGRLPAYLAGFRGLRGALLLPGGHLEPPATVAALAAAFASRGELLTGAEALGFRTAGAPGSRRVEAVVTGAGRLRAGTVVLAGGAFGGALAAALGVPLPIVPVKGQILAVRTPPALRAWQEGMVPVFAGRLYLVPKADGRTVIGATEEPAAGFDRSVTLGALADLAAGARRLLPGLRAASWVMAWAGLRPGSPDRRPLLGPLPGFRNVLVAGGHFRNGILLAPLTGRIIAALAAGRAPEVDLAPFDPARFAGSPRGAGRAAPA